MMGSVKIVPNDNIWKNVIVNQTTGVVKAPPSGDAKPPEAERRSGDKTLVSLSRVVTARLHLLRNGD